MTKALTYGRKRWDALTRFLTQGIAEIDNKASPQGLLVR